MVNIKLKYNFVETPCKFIIAKLSIQCSDLHQCIIISIEEDPSLQVESFAIINLRRVSTKLFFNLFIVSLKCLFIVCNILKIASISLRTRDKRL